MTGNNPNVPMKLKAGMHVIVFIKPHAPLLFWEKEAGIAYEKWLPAILKGFSSDGWAVIEVYKERIALHSSQMIVIRSTALKHNQKANKIRDKLARQAKRQRREMLASLKVVKPECK